MTATMLVEGERTTVSERVGYKLAQNRPYSCRYLCECGECDGVVTEYEGTVEKMIYWMDNSVEAVVRCDDGETRSKMLRHPSGDVCF